MLERIFQDKDNWKKDTFNLIKNELLSVKENRFVQFETTRESHLACVYGKSQVGKTTLILNMIGLRDELCRKAVSEVLRGGVSRGNSSTSTAILYSQSNTDLYGIRIEQLDMKGGSAPINYYSPEEMVMQLKKIRDDVENNSFCSRSILHIFIPQCYFSDSAETDNISILDLPGVESRNVKEKAHVESLMARYIPLSSICIIVCTANTIQSLETEELPNDIDWKNLSHRFVVLVTKSYSNGSIKSYFKTPRSQRHEGFKDFVLNRYKEELSNIIRNDNIEVFPLDVGDSFENLINVEISNDEDCNELRQTRNTILSSLRECIVRHKGEQLLSAIKDLHALVELSDKEKLSSLEKELKSKHKDLKECNDFVQQKELKLCECQSKIEDTKEENKSLIDNNLTKQIKLDVKNYTNNFSKQLIEAVRRTIEDKKLTKVKSGGIYFCDKEKCIKQIISDFVLTQMKIGEMARNKMKEWQINIDFYDNSLANSIYSKFSEQYEDKLYPPPSGSLDRLFGDGCKISLSSALEYIGNIKDIVGNEVQDSIFAKCQERIKIKTDEINDEINSWKRQKKIIQKKISKKNEQIKGINEEIHRIEYEKGVVGDQKEHDQDTLRTYLKFAKMAYFRQKDKIIRKMNSNITSEEKVLYLFLLGVIDKDYKLLIATSNG